MPESLERPALYYPYIHVRSEHWLKATLLCIPVVKRIVPETYEPEDEPIIRPYTEIKGPFGTLLQSVPAWSSAAYAAQERLLAILQKNEEQFTNSFGREKAPFRDEYWIHDAKFSERLLTYLEQKRLAWPSMHSKAYGRRNWHALHPTLGSAIMTTLGLSIAREQNYDIITDSGEFHEALLGTSEDEVFAALLARGPKYDSAASDQARRDLGQAVITLTGVNFRAVRPESIPDLQASQHFKKFQQLIRTRVQAIDVQKQDMYGIQLRAAAEEIIQSWQEARGYAWKEVKTTLLQQAPATATEAVRVYMHSLGATDIFAVAGIGIGLLKAGSRLLKKDSKPDPYRYLTQLVASQDNFLRLSFPLGLAS